MNRYKRSEKAQAIYIVALGLVMLMGLTALAIDGGAIYAERRRAYNAADTSALTGALTIAEAGGGDPYAAASAMSQAEADAIARAVANQYDNSDPDVTVTATATGPFSDEGVYYFVEVEITSALPTNFAHLVYGGPLVTTVKAVARARPAQNIATGFAVFANSESSCDAIFVHGNTDKDIKGGTVRSNSTGNGGACAGGKVSGTSALVSVQPSPPYDISSVGSWDISGSPTWGPQGPPTSGAQQTSFPPIPIPDCSGLPNRGSVTVNGNQTIYPGVYGSIRVNTGTLTLSPVDESGNPGLYCIFGSAGFSSTGGLIEGGDSNAAAGQGVTIYLRDGSFDIGGNTIVHLYAPTNLIDNAGQQWGGMLIYMDEANDGLVRINGGTTTEYRGTIYAPGPPNPPSQPKCSILGTGDAIGVNSQIICYTVELGGNAILDLYYENDQNFTLPASIDLLE